MSAFAVIPAFGLANAGVELSSETLETALTSPVTIGVMVSLILGNGLGITMFAVGALRSGVGMLPGGVRYGHLVGAALLAGIGFTISLFITDLAFDDESLQDQAKIGILAGSMLAAVIGVWVLRVMGERMPLCSPSGDTAPPELPPLPWTGAGLPPHVRAVESTAPDPTTTQWWTSDSSRVGRPPLGFQLSPKNRRRGWAAGLPLVARRIDGTSTTPEYGVPLMNSVGVPETPLATPAA